MNRMVNEKEVLQSLVKAVAGADDRLRGLGVDVGKLYTDHGLPIDIALDRLALPKEDKIVVLSGALWWLIEHRRNSNATEESLERQRKANRNMMERFINTGEVGAY